MLLAEFTLPGPLKLFVGRWQPCMGYHRLGQESQTGPCVEDFEVNATRRAGWPPARCSRHQVDWGDI